MSPARSRAARGSGQPAPLGGLLAGQLLVVLVALSGCGGSEPALPEPTRTAGGDVGAVSTAADGFQEITLETGDDYVFTPATFTVAPGQVRLTVRNSAAQMTHNFEFTAGTPGDYPFECTFHVALGQVGTMTVSG